MTSKIQIPLSDDDLIATWPIAAEARLGSSVRGKGIFLELRARLPAAARKALTIKSGELTLRMPRDHARDFAKASQVIAKGLVGIEDLPVIPREIEDILSIKTSERHRWLKDGRLPSAGTRTVRLRGRARQITFHVFDPRVVEDILNRDLVDAWREDDAESAGERRRQALWKARLKREEQSGRSISPALDVGSDDDERFKLKGWAEFERDGLLR